MMTFRHKHTAALASAVLLTQSVCGGLPVTRMRAVDTVRSAAEFADMVTASVQQPKEPFETLRYDAAADQLYQDGNPVGKRYGGFEVRDGMVYAAGVPVSEEQASGIEIQTEPDGSFELRSPFQSARLIVSSSEPVDPMGGTVTAEGYHDLHVIQYASPAQAYSAYCTYQQDSRIAFAEPDRYYYADLPQLPAADVKGKNAADDEKSWGYHAIGSEEYLSWLKSQKTELPEITAAVIDTGIYADHNWFTGRISDKGLDCTEGKSALTDVHGHGTHCAGIICQNTPEQVKIMPVKVITDMGTGTDLMLYCGLMYAIEQKADVISMSLGGDGDSPLVHEAIRAAYEADIPCCVATGNDGYLGPYSNPGAFDEVFSISACCIKPELTDTSFLDYSNPNMYSSAVFSNVGPFVDFTAPGLDILSAYNRGKDDLQILSGTSMATPFAAAACADLLCAQPELNIAELRETLEQNTLKLTDPIVDTPPEYSYGAGMINLRLFGQRPNDIREPDISVAGADFMYNTYEAEDAVTVSIRSDYPDAEIRYTTDGSEPDENHGTIYQDTFSVTKSAVIRAAVIVDGKAGNIAEAYICIGSKDIDEPFVVKDGVLTAYKGVNPKIDLNAAFPDGSLLEIGEGVFRNNNRIVSVVLPDSVTKIGAFAFSQSAVYYLKADGVTEIGDYAFGDSAISNLNIGTISKIGTGAFCGATALTWLPAFSDSLTEIPDHAFENCPGFRLFDGNFDHIRKVGKYAFYQSGPSDDVSFPKLESLGEHAFTQSNITGIYLSPAIKVLEKSVFEGCTALKRIEAPGVTSLKYFSLTNCPLESADFLSQVTDLETDSIFCCNFNIKGGISFDALKNMEIAAISYNSSTSPLIFPNIKKLTPDMIANNEAPIWLPNAESIVLDDNNRCIRVSETLTDIEIRSSSAAGYIIGPQESCAKTEAERNCIPYFESKKLYLDQDNVKTGRGSDITLFCEYVADENMSVRWYRLIDDAEQAIDQEYITVVGAEHDINTSALIDSYDEAGDRKFRVALYDGERRVESRDITLTVEENYMEPQTPAQIANPMNYFRSATQYHIGQNIFKLDEDILFDPACLRYCFYADKPCMVKIKAVNRHVEISAGMISMQTGQQELSSTEPTEMLPGYYQVQDIHGSNNDVFKMPLVFRIEKIAESIMDAEATVQDAVYTGTPAEPQVLVVLDDQELKSGTDYKVSCDTAMTEPGQYTVCIEGIGKYYGTIWRTFCILPKESKEAASYTGGECSVLPEDSGQPVILAWKPDKKTYCLQKHSLPLASVSVTDAEGSTVGSVSGLGTQLTELTVNPGSEYRISITNFYPEKQTTVSFSLTDDYRLLDDIECEITKAVMYGETPVITARDGDTVLIEGKDYSVFCKSTDQYLGNAVIVVHGEGKYIGEKELYFKYLPIDTDTFPNMPYNGQPGVVQLELNTPSVFQDDHTCFPGTVEKFLFTVPEDDTYTLTLPDEELTDTAKVLYVNDEVPVVIEETNYQTTLKKGDEVQILLIHGYLRQTPINAITKPITVMISASDASYETEIDGIGYRIQNGNAIVSGISSKDKGLVIPSVITDPKTGKEIPVTDIDKIAYAAYCRSCTIFTETDSPIAKICKEADYIYAVTDSASETAGDISGDGKADYRDVLILQQYLAESAGITPDRLRLGNTDLNQDGSIGFDDLILLMQCAEKPPQSSDLYAVYRRVKGDLYD